MSEQVKVVVTIWARASAAGDVEAIVLELCEKSRQEKGCTGYEVLRNEADGNGFVLFEEWESGAHLDAHNKTAHVAKAVTSVQPFLAKPLEIGRYAVIM